MKVYLNLSPAILILHYSAFSNFHSLQFLHFSGFTFRYSCFLNTQASKQFSCPVYLGTSVNKRDVAGHGLMCSSRHVFSHSPPTFYFSKGASAATTPLLFNVYVLLLLDELWLLLYMNTQWLQIRQATAEIHAHAIESGSYVRISQELHMTPHTSMH